MDTLSDMDVGIKGATERQLRSVLNSAKGCWDEECETILSHLQIFHYDRLSHALKMLVPGFCMLHGSKTILKNWNDNFHK